MKRRDLFALGAALSAPAIVQAQSGQVVVGTWGGDYATLLARHIDTPLLRPRGIEVVQDVGPQTARMTKLIAERTSRRGSMDVVCLSDADTHAMAAQGLLEEITPANVPNLAHVLPALRNPHGVPHIYSVRTVLYLPARVDPPPRGYADLFDPRFRNRIGFSDLLYGVISESASIVAGGNESNYTPGRAKLLEWRAMGARVYPSNETLAAALRSEESWATIMWLARGYMWRKAGIPVRHVVPVEGCSPYVSSAAVPKNARNKEGAYAWLNAMLDPSAAQGFAENMGFLPTTTNATLPPELSAEIGITPAEQAAMRRPDFDYIARTNNEVLNFWNREFKG